MNPDDIWLSLMHKEKAEGKVAVRVRGGKDLGAMSVEDFIKLVQEDVATRRNVNEIE